MRSHVIPFINGLPDWEKVPMVEIDTAPWQPAPKGLKAQAQVCYDSEALKVRLRAEEKNILARFEGLLDSVCLDSCLEFFFSPCEGRYFNFEFNPKGAMFLGFGSNRHDSVRQILHDYKKTFSVNPFLTGTGWGVDFVIPEYFVGLYVPSFKLEKGLKLRGNFYKCGDETEIPHYLVWNNIEWEKPDYHRPEFFGELILGAGYEP